MYLLWGNAVFEFKSNEKKLTHRDDLKRNI